MLRFLGLSFVLLIATASPAAAEQWWDDIDRAGATLGLSASVGGMLSINDLERPGVNIDEDIAAGLHGKLGYRLARWFGGELHVEYLKQRLEVVVGSINPDPEADVVTFTGDFKLLIPHWANGQFFLIAGPGLINVDGRTKFAARFGGGVDLYFTRSVGMNIGGSYVLTTSSLKEFDYVTGDVGFFYRF